MTRSSLFVLSAALALPIAVSALAIDHPSVVLPAAQAKTEVGTIKSADVTANTFVLTTGSGDTTKDVTIRVSKDTKYTLDGKDSTADKALVAGHKATVMHTDGTASKVDATTVKKP